MTMVGVTASARAEDGRGCDRPTRLGSFCSLDESDQLGHSEAELDCSTIYDTAPVGLACLSPDCRYLRVNQRITDICGVSPEDHIGRSVRDVVPDLAQGIENIVHSILATGQPIRGIEICSQRTDNIGRDRCWITHWQPVKDADGNIVAINVAAEEITARKYTDWQVERSLHASNERWKSVFESSTLGISLIDQDLKFVAINAAFANMLGYPEEEEVRQLSPLDLLTDSEADDARVQMQELFEGKQHHYEATRRFRRKDGSCVFVHKYSSLISGTETSPPLLLTTAIDVSARMHAEAALHEAQAELSRGTRLMMMGELAASIAHEINQPLMGVVTFGQSALRWLGGNEPNLEKATASIKGMISAGNRASEVMTGIRTLLKSDKPKYVELDINETIREVMVLARSTLQSRGISVHTYLASNLDRAKGDRVQLQQVVMNLLINGADAMNDLADGSKILRLGSKVVDGNVIVAVEDFGTGVDDSIVERIFAPLFTTKESGMGMGLSICRSIIEAHSGQIWVTPGTSRGTIFQFSLPACAGAVGHDEGHAKSARQALS